MKTKITIEVNSQGLIDRDEAVSKLMDQIDILTLANYQSIDDMIDFSLRHKTIVQMAKEHYRGLGKTTKLAQKAKELGATLVVPNGNALQYLLSEGYTNGTYFSHPMYTRGHRFPNGFLVDEGVSPDIIKSLCESNELLGGFSRV